MSSSTMDYLKSLPDRAANPGDHSRGEIEILTRREDVIRVAADRREKVHALGLDPDAAKLGTVMQDEYVMVSRDPVRFPDGGTGTYLRIIETASLDGPGGVIIVALRDGRVCLRRVFRHATRSWEWEFPRGFRGHGRSVDEAARLEIAEEIGLPAVEMAELGRVVPNSGLLSAEVAVVLAELDGGTPMPAPEATEAFGELAFWSVEELLTAVARGTVRDGLTLSALMLVLASGRLASPVLLAAEGHIPR